MLSVKLSNMGLSADGTSITLKDTTGTYDAGANPGGYGAPNETSGAASRVFLRYYIYGHDPVNIPVAIADMIAGKVFNPYSLLLNSDPAEPYLLPDGVNIFEYLVGYLVTGGSPTVTGKTVDVSGLTVPASSNYISFSSFPEVTYKIVSRVGNTLLVDKDIVSSPGNALTAFYSFRLPLLIDTYINRLIDKKVIALSTLCDRDLELFEDVLNLISATARFEAQDYAGANDLITTLNRRYAYADR